MKKIFFICMVAICSHAYSQHYMDNWYFGIYSSINFSSGSPIFHYSPMRGFEANATISDSLGNLLFFTNGISVWDRNENMMPNGDGLEIGAQVNIPLSIGSSITQGVIILPKPGNKKQYYIFYLANGFATDDVYSGKHLKYSIVDMNLNGGNGDILTSQKNIIVNSGDYLWEKLTAVKHGNGMDWWLVGLSGRLVEPDSFYFEKFLITEDGISDPEFQFYDLWSSSYESLYSDHGQMKFSLLGEKLANTRGSDIDVFTFNRCNGIIGNRLTIDTVHNKSYGIEFSSDESKLYVSTWGGPPNKAALYQVCLDCIPIKKTRLIIYPTGSMG